MNPPNKKTTFKKSSGVTLVEMLVALAIVVIVSTMVIPNFQRIVFSNRVASSSNEIVSLLKFGQMEAIRTRTRVVACASLDGRSCSGTNWERAIVFKDDDRSGSRGSSETILRNLNFSETGVQIKQNKSGTVSFNGNGIITTSGSASDPFTISICSPKASKKTNVITLNGAGVQHSKKEANCG